MWFANLYRASSIHLQIVECWRAFATRWPPIAIVIVVWALLTMPLVFFRGFNSDEGLAVAIAKTALEHGNWLVPHVFNERFAERPALLSWIIALISLPFGGVSQFLARFPISLFLLGGCLLIFSLLQKVACSKPASLVGVAVFLASPIVMRSYVMTTADMPLAVTLFLAFVLWWNGFSQGAIHMGRWASIGVVLAAAALMKGPQPISYFAIGIGLFIVWTRSWRQLPGLILAGAICVIPVALWYAYVYEPGDLVEWATFMRLTPTAPLAGPIEATRRLFVETLPASLMAAALLLSVQFGTYRGPPLFIRALLCYALPTALVILFWPGGSTTRYFFPAILPLSVLAGLGYDALAKNAKVLAPLLIVTQGIFVYAFGYSFLAPLMPRLFRSSQLDAARISDLVRANPAPIYRTGAIGLNVFPYISGTIRSVDLPTLEEISGPAWIAATPEEASMLMSKRPAQLHVALTFGYDNEWRLLRLDN